jgi:hypothetical protein
MSATSRRAFLGLAQGAVAAAAIGAVGARFIETAEAMPVAPHLEQAAKPSLLVEPAQGRGPPPRRGWGRPRPRRRRWVCWWHRGRRRCGWR